MIVNVRGANGSGKSTVVRKLMVVLSPTLPQPIYGLLGPSRPEAYELSLAGVSKGVFLLGPYDIPTGGCDCLRSGQVVGLLQKYYDRGHVLFEGSLISDHWGEVGEFMDKHIEDTVLAFMSATYEECLTRLRQRRNSRGEMKALDPKRTAKRHYEVARTKRNFIDGRFRTVTLSDDRGAEEILELYRAAS